MFIWGFGYGLYTNIFSIVASHLGADETGVALIFSAAYVVSMLGYIPGGMLADRYSRKWVLVAGWAIGTPSALIFAFATSWHWLVAGQVLYFLSNFCMPAFWAHLAGFCDEKNAGFTFSFTGSAFSVAAIAAPAIGGALAGALGASSVFLISFASYVVSTMLLFGLEDRAREFPRRTNVDKELANGQPDGVVHAKENAASEYLAILRNPKFAAFTVVFGLVNLVVFLARPYLPLFLWSEYHLSYIEIGVLGSIGGMGAVALQIALGRMSDKMNRYRAIAFALFIFSFSFALLVVTGNLAALAVSFFLMGAANASTSIANSIVGLHAGKGSEGKAFALFSTVTYVPLALSPFVGGGLYSAGPFLPFYAALLSAPIVAVAFLSLERSRYA